MITTIQSAEQVRAAFLEAGYECAGVGGSVSGSQNAAPHPTGRPGEDCYFFSTGQGRPSTCAGSKYGHRLCYCGKVTDGDEHPMTITATGTSSAPDATPCFAQVYGRVLSYSTSILS